MALSETRKLLKQSVLFAAALVVGVTWIGAACTCVGEEGVKPFESSKYCLGALTISSWNLSEQHAVEKFGKLGLQPPKIHGVLVEELRTIHAERLRAGDIIISLNGKEIVDEPSMNEAWSCLDVAPECKLGVKRFDKGKNKWISMTIRTIAVDRQKLESLPTEVEAVKARRLKAEAEAEAEAKRRREIAKKVFVQLRRAELFMQLSEAGIEGRATPELVKSLKDEARALESQFDAEYPPEKAVDSGQVLTPP